MTITFNPALHMKAVTRAVQDGRTPCVMVIGDSISTPQPGITFDETQSLSGLIQAQFVKQNPGVSFRFLDRGIGATRWDMFHKGSPFLTLDDLAAVVNVPGVNGFTPWPDNPTFDPAVDAWSDVVVADAPDVIFFNWGMNDGISHQFVRSKFDAVIQNLKIRLPNTDLVIITPMVPNFYATGNVGGIDAQNGRLFVRNWLATYATKNGLGLIDIGAEMCRKVAGFDPSNVILTGSSFSAFTPYTAPVTEGDFGIVAVRAANNALWSSRIKITTGHQGPNAKAWIEIYRVDGNVAVELVTQGNIAGRTEFVSTVPAPITGDCKISVFVRGAVLRVEVNDAMVFNGLFARDGGRFSPVLSFLDDRSVSVTGTNYTGKFEATEPVMTFADMFGLPSVAGSTEGGNNLNHPTAQGWARVFAPYLRDCDFTLPSLRPEGLIEGGGVIGSVGNPALPAYSVLSIVVPPTPGILTIHSTRVQLSAVICYNAAAAPENRFANLGSLVVLADPNTVLTGTNGTSAKVNVSIRNGFIQINNNTGTPVGVLNWKVEAME